MTIQSSTQTTTKIHKFYPTSYTKSLKNKLPLEKYNQLLGLLVSQSILQDHEHHAYDTTANTYSNREFIEQLTKLWKNIFLKKLGRETRLIQKGGTSLSLCSMTPF